MSSSRINSVYEVKDGVGPTHPPNSLPLVISGKNETSTSEVLKSNCGKVEVDFEKAKTSVWWDIENCDVPRDCDPQFVAHNITTALLNFGYVGPVSISAYGDTNRLSVRIQHAFNSTGVTLKHVPAGVKDASDKRILVDMLLWAIDNPAPANYLLISGDRDFSNALHQLRMRRYNILLAQPSRVSSALVAAASNVWMWTSLVLGIPTDSPSSINNRYCQQSKIQCHKCGMFGHKKIECSSQPMNQPFLENKNICDSDIANIPTSGEINTPKENLDGNNYSLKNGNCDKNDNDMVSTQEQGVDEVKDTKKRKANNVLKTQNQKKPRRGFNTNEGRIKVKPKQDVKRTNDKDHPGTDCKGKLVKRANSEDKTEQRFKCQKCSQCHPGRNCQGNILCFYCREAGHYKNRCPKYIDSKNQLFLPNMNNFCNNQVTNVPNASENNNEQVDSQNFNKNNVGSTHDMWPVSVVQGGGEKETPLVISQEVKDPSTPNETSSSSKKGLFQGVQTIFQTVSKFALG